LPVAALLIAAGPTVDWSHAQPMTVTMVDNVFQPDHLTFQHDTPYRLHLENRGKDLHEFTAPEFFAASVVRDPSQLANGGKEIVLQSGASTDVDLEPLKPGTYHLICADHDWDGMVGEILVK
jgi:plastocyanin